MVDLLKAAYTLEDYNRMIEIADRLQLSAKNVYSRQERSLNEGRKYICLEGKRHIVYYFGFSALMKGIALEKLDRFEEARQCIADYADLSWLDDKSEDAANDIGMFKMFAEANTLAIHVLEGTEKSIDNYVEFLDKSRAEELLPGLMTILISAINHGLSVDAVLEHFEIKIRDTVKISSQKGESIYLAKFYYRLSIYRLNMGNKKLAIHSILKALETSDTFNNVTIFKKCVVMFEALRSYADVEQQERYTILMKTLLREELKNEKGAFIDGDCIEFN